MNIGLYMRTLRYLKPRQLTTRVLVLPHSNDYGSPMELFEYLASGRPAVFRDLPVVREVVRHEEHALLLRPGDHLELAPCLRRLLGDRELRLREGVRARRRELSDEIWSQKSVEYCRGLKE